MKFLEILVLGAIVLPGWAANFDCKASQVVVFSRIEAQATASLPSGVNPFNTSELDITATSHCTSCGTHAVSFRGFYYQNFSRSGASGIMQDIPTGPPSYMVRFTPSQKGNYTMNITVTIQGSVALTGSCSFEAVASTDGAGAGFVHVGRNKQHFVRSSDNAVYFPVGMNLGWVSGGGQADIDAFIPYLQNLTAHNASYVRVWMTDSWDDLFLEDQLLNYSLPNAWHVDRLLEVCERLGVRVLMSIESFNLFCSRSSGPCAWSKSVYNKANGGILAKADQFFTDDTAKTYFKQRLAYISARFGHSTSVFAWEFFNEVDLTDNFSEDAQAAWIGEMAPFLRKTDPYSHPISTSFCCRDVASVNSQSVIDFTMTHTYGSHNTTDMADDVFFWIDAKQSYIKPTYIAETGESGAQNSGTADPSGIGLHNALWTSVASGAAGTAMTWWWDSWVAPYDLYPQFDAVGQFVATVPWDNAKWTPVTQPNQCTDIPPSKKYTCAQQKSWGKCNADFMQGYCCSSCTNCSEACVGRGEVMLDDYTRVISAAGTGIEGETYYAVAWLQNINHTYSGQNATAESKLPLLPFTASRVSLTLAELPEGMYSFTWYNTTNFSTVGSGQATCRADEGPETVCTLDCPAFNTDVVMFMKTA